MFLKADFEEMRNEARLEKSGRVLLEVEEEERELSDEEVVEQRWDGTPEEYYEQVGMDGARQELYEDEEEDGIESEQEGTSASAPSPRSLCCRTNPNSHRQICLSLLPPTVIPHPSHHLTLLDHRLSTSTLLSSQQDTPKRSDTIRTS